MGYLEYFCLMSKLEITFLGTGTSQGIPVIGSDHPVSLSEDPKDKRLRSSVKITWGEHVYVCLLYTSDAADDLQPV